MLDGSSRELEARLAGVAEEFGRRIRPLFLPGDGPPEAWVWQMLSRDAPSYASAFGLDADDLQALMRNFEDLLDGAPRQRPGSRAALAALADELNRTEQQVARTVGKLEAHGGGGDIAVFRTALEDAIGAWRKHVQ